MSSRTRIPIAAIVALAAAAHGQTCTPEWSREFIEQGLNDTVETAVVYDLDGPGPGAETLVVGGVFTGAGDTLLTHVAAWTGAGWAPVGAGLVGSVRRLAVVDEDGAAATPPALFACGEGPSSVHGWNGAGWSALGGNFNHQAEDIVAFDADGPGPAAAHLIVVGRFTAIGTIQLINRVARWNGAAWEPLPAGGLDQAAEALAVYDEDGPGPNPARLFIGGEFIGRITRYDGQTFTPVGGGLSGGSQRVHCMEVWDADGPGPNPLALYVGGRYNTAGGTPALGVARWDGQNWSALGTGLQGDVFDLLPIDDDGPGPNAESLIAVGLMDHLNPPYSSNVSRFSGTDWVAVGTGTNANADALVSFDFDGPGPQAARAVMVGSFTDCASSESAPVTATRVAAWDGGQWLPVGPIANNGMDDYISVLSVHDEDGPGPLPMRLFAGGRFKVAGDNEACRRIARRDGSAWASLGAAHSGNVYSMTTHDEDGPGGAPARLFAAGSFASIGAVTTRVGRWDGAAWSAVGTGLNLSNVYALSAWDPDGPGATPTRLIAAGDRSTGPIHVREWDGAAWNNVGTNFGHAVRALAVFDPDGSGPAPERLVAGGVFTQIGSSSIRGIAEWNGTSWLQLGSGLSTEVNTLAVFDEDGAGPNPARLFAGGRLLQAGSVELAGIARWNGTAWTAVPLPSNYPGPGSDVHALTVFDHDGPGPQAAALYLAGSFGQSFHIGGSTVDLDNVARWSGTDWSSLTTGVNWDARALAALDPDGRGPTPPALYIGGRLTTAGGVSSARIARWSCDFCYPDCSADGQLSVADFGCFQTKFVAQDPYADCNADGSLTVADFGCFQTSFVNGCP